MSHYRRAPGKPQCPKGSQCLFKKPEHWQSVDHPPNHPKLLRAAGHAKNGASQPQQPAFDRSHCALAGREGDDPTTATYTCAGCGTQVVGFGRWRNHMKRAKKRSDGTSVSAGGGAITTSKRPFVRAALLAHHEHTPAWATSVEHPEEPGATAPKRADPIPSTPEAPKVAARAEGKVVWRLSGKEKRALAEATALPPAAAAAAPADSRGPASYKSTKRAQPPPAAEVEPTSDMQGDESQPKALGKRWLSEPGKNGKRQRKFF